MYAKKTFISAANACAIALISLLVLSSACRSSSNQTPPDSETVVKSPTNGVVRRVLVSEGSEVDQGSALIEIAIEAKQPSDKKPVSEQQTKLTTRSSKSDLAAAESEASRAADKVRRVEPLVARGYASRADLDAARASYQDALGRLQRLRDNSQETRDEKNGNSSTAPAVTVTPVLSPAGGTVHGIAVEPGQSVTVGQPLVIVQKKEVARSQ